MKNILILSSSPRKNGNSEALARAFAEGARSAGNVVELISLLGKDIRFCRGCFACQKTHRCVMRDDADLIEQKMARADVLVFATPIYYYEMSGQLKTMLDRSNPMYDSEYAFRQVYFLSAAADDAETTPARALAGVEGWIECFEKARLSGSLFLGGVNDVGDAEGSPVLQEAYEMGKRA